MKKVLIPHTFSEALGQVRLDHLDKALLPDHEKLSEMSQQTNKIFQDRNVYSLDS